MKLLLKVSIFEWCDVGADYAFVDLTPEYAKQLLKRKALFEEAQAKDGGECFGLYEMHYWNDPCLWLGGEIDRDDPTEEIPEDADMWSFLDEHLSAEQQKDLNGGDPVIMPDDFEVPEYFAQRTEMGQTVVDLEDVYFTSYPRHYDHEQHTMNIPWALIERAAA